MNFFIKYQEDCETAYFNHKWQDFSFKKVFYSMFQCKLLVTDIDWIFSIVVRVSKVYSTSVMSKKDPIANDLIKIIDDNPFASQIFL